MRVFRKLDKLLGDLTMNRVTEGEIWIESEAELATTREWSVPLRLAKAIDVGETAHLGSLWPRQARNLPTACDIFSAWSERRPVPLDFDICTDSPAPAKGVSLFFSGGVDSFYSLIKHRDEVDNLILIHGFDVPLADTKSFALAEERAHEAAQAFSKRLIVVRTNLYWEQPSVPVGWQMYHGPALAAVALALAPNHGKIHVASSYSYADLYPWGSHPLLDPYWSSDAVDIVHDTGELRIDKLRVVSQNPDALSRLRPCWKNLANYNCGLCEKCVRTMLGLRALGIERCAAFPDTLRPDVVRRQKLDHGSVLHWRELLNADLPSDLHAAVKSAIHSRDIRLPPRNGEVKREFHRWLLAVRRCAGALISPIDR
jgi:hypothetical protein